MLKILRYLRKKEILLALLSSAFIVVQVWLELTMPDYMSTITKLVQTEGSTMDEILKSGAMMLLCAFGSLASSICTAICASKIAANFSSVLRRNMFEKVHAFSMEEIGRFSTASLITRSTNDVTQVQMLVVLGLQVMIKAPIMAIWAIAKISTKQWQWTMSTGIAVIVLLIVVGICIAIATPKFKKIQQLTDDINRVTRENLTGIRVVRAYNAENYQEAKFEAANENLTSTQLFAQRTLAFLLPSIQAIMSGLALSIYWIGSVLIDFAGLTDKIEIFSEMVVFSQYAIQVVMSFMMLVIIFMLVPRASVAANRILEVLDTKITIKDGTRTAGDPDKKGEIEFKNVSFRYPDAAEPVIKNISFKVGKGETTAIIGSTGCGKSTLINLIPRFYDVTDGSVLVDGVDVREYSQKALRDRIGYVSQKSVLFTGDIKSNISYGDNGREKSSIEKIKEAAKIAQADDFIETVEGDRKSVV